MLPSWIADEVAHGHATEADVIAAVDECLKHFETRAGFTGADPNRDAPSAG